MKIETQPLEDHEIKVLVEVSAEDFEPLKQQAARKIAGQAKISGFRPGKAPYDVIRRNYGDAAIAQEALDILLEKQYEEILKEAAIEPGGMGRLDKVEEIDPPKFSIIIPQAPVIELNDYREIREDYEETTITEDEVSEALYEIKSNYATEEPSDGPAKEGQVVYTLIRAELAEADPETGNKELIKERPFEVVIGKDTDEKSSWPFVGFSQNLIGATPDQVITTEHTFDDKAPVASLRDKKAIFYTTVQSIKDIVMPEENVELAKKFGEFESFDALVEDVRKRLLEQKTKMNEDQYIEKIVNKLVEKSEIKYAPNALEEEAQEMLNSFKQRIAQQGIDFETYLKIQKTDVGKFLNEEIRPNAEAQLKRKLAMQEFAAKEKIKIDLDKFKAAVSSMEMSMAPHYKTAKTKKQKDEITNYITQTAMNQSFSDLMFDRLIAIAKGENPEIEPVKPAETEPEQAEEPAENAEVVTVNSDETIKPARKTKKKAEEEEKEAE